MLYDIPSLNRPARFDVLSALAAEVIPDDASVSDAHVFHAIVEVLRDQIESPRDQVAETLRRRTVDVAEQLDVLRTAALAAPAIYTYDMLSDAQLLWGIAWTIFNEFRASEDEANDELPGAVGRRLTAYPTAIRQRLLGRIAQAGHLASAPRPIHYYRDEIARVLAGDVYVAGLEDLDPPPNKAQVAGWWTCRTLESASSFVIDERPRRIPELAVYKLAVPVGETLAAWLLSRAGRDGGDRDSAGSTRTRARKARSARAVGILALATAIYRRPDPLPP